jgi:glutamyl-tRNA synthetase
VFDTVKLEWMNGQYLSAADAADLVPAVERQLAVLGVSPEGRDLRPLIDAVKLRSRTLLQLAEQVAVRLAGPRGEPDERAAALRRKLGPDFARNLVIVADALRAVPAEQWTADILLERVRTAAEAAGLKLGDAMQPVRVALTGSTVSEPVNELLATVGPEASLRRIEAAAGI